MATTADKLRKRRMDLSKTQSEIARAAGMSTVQYNGYENARHEPSDATMIRIAKALKAKADDLWADAEENPESSAGLKVALQRQIADDLGVKVSNVRILIELT